MKPALRNPFFLLLGAYMGSQLTGCDGSDGGTNVETGQIVVAVATDGAAEPGVTLRLFAEGGTVPLSTATTGGNGTATFGEVDPGAYDVELALPAGLVLAVGESARKGVSVTAAGVVQIEFALTESGGGENGEVVEVILTSSFTFSPSEVTISPGTTVRWVNAAAIYHTITPDGHSEWSAATVTQAGQTFEHTFQAAGTFPYYCEPHRALGMAGTITVQ